VVFHIYECGSVLHVRSPVSCTFPIGGIRGDMNMHGVGGSSVLCCTAKPRLDDRFFFCFFCLRPVRIRIRNPIICGLAFSARAGI
jgi:hypothetical protein